MTNKQLSMFELLGEPETPKIPPEEQKKGQVGWIIDISAILLKKNGCREDAICVCTTPIKFEQDSKKDKYGRWSQYASSTHGPHHGWWGPVKTVYAARPTWEECVEYARSKYTIPEKVLYYERDGNFNETWGYENGYTKGSRA